MEQEVRIGKFTKKLKGKYLNISVFQMLGLNTLFVVVDFATVLFCCF